MVAPTFVDTGAKQSSNWDLEAIRSYASRFFAGFLWIHVPVVAAISLSNGMSPLPVSGAMAVAAAVGSLAALLGGGGLIARLVIAACLTAAPALMVYAGSGPWQADWHMYFFVVYGMLVAYVDWRPIALAAALTAAHHFILDLVFSTAVFPEASLGRVALHATIVLADGLVLFWIVGQLAHMFSRSSLLLRTAGDALTEAQLFKSAVVHASDGIVIGETGSDYAGNVDSKRRRVIFANAAASTITDLSNEELLAGKFMVHLASESDVSSAEKAMNTSLVVDEGGADLNFRRPDGRDVRLESSLVRVGGEDGSVSSWMAILRDVTEQRGVQQATLRAEVAEENNATLQREVAERKLAEQRLSYAVYHDALTALPNRAMFVGRLSKAMNDRERSFRPAVLFCDIDRFKHINDGLGHLCGDQLLVAVAARLAGTLRKQDLIARLGGDEFTILVQDASSVGMLTSIAERALDSLSTPIIIAGREIYVSVSIGIAMHENWDQTADELLRNADIAMYRAKSLGKGGYELFTPELLKRSESLLRLETDLHSAIETPEIYVHYQPMIELLTGITRGFEALVRWSHPAVGMIAPSEFIPLAEESGLIVPIGNRVLDDACRQLRCWLDMFPQRPDLFMSVNVSPVQLKEANYVSGVLETLAAHSLRGKNLHLEITETTLASDLEAVVPLLTQLREREIHIEVDDFGTGYSSLQYLDRLPIDSLKIDRSFISGRGNGVANLKITQIIVDFARALNLEVTAEGVETESQVRTLRGMTKYAQGYFFGKPVSAAEALGHLLPPRTPALAS